MVCFELQEDLRLQSRGDLSNIVTFHGFLGVFDRFVNISDHHIEIVAFNKVLIRILKRQCSPGHADSWEKRRRDACFSDD
jgi:hypothetical protein